MVCVASFGELHSDHLPDIIKRRRWDIITEDLPPKQSVYPIANQLYLRVDPSTETSLLTLGVIHRTIQNAAEGREPIFLLVLVPRLSWVGAAGPDQRGGQYRRLQLTSVCCQLIQLGRQLLYLLTLQAQVSVEVQCCHSVH